jgi:non-heme chloroperoxidase
MSMISTPDGAFRANPQKGFAAAGAGVTAAKNPAPAGTGKPVADRLTTKDGSSLYFKDWGSGPAAVFSHGYPLSSDAWEDQMFFLLQSSDLLAFLRS